MLSKPLYLSFPFTLAWEHPSPLPLPLGFGVLVPPGILPAAQGAAQKQLRDSHLHRPCPPNRKTMFPSLGILAHPPAPCRIQRQRRPLGHPQLLLASESVLRVHLAPIARCLGLSCPACSVLPGSGSGTR